MADIVLAFGNELKSDDGAGKYIIGKLKKEKAKKLLIYGGLAPENCIQKLAGKRFSVLYIVDAADFGSVPGEIKILGKVPRNITLSTHSAELGTFLKYVRARSAIGKVKIILIQAKSLDFGKNISPEVKAAADKVVSLLS